MVIFGARNFDLAGSAQHRKIFHQQMVALMRSHTSLDGPATGSSG